MRLRNPFLVGLIFIGVGCYRYVNLEPPPDAHAAARETWLRLEQLGSFRFRLNYRSSAPLSLGGSFTGTWQRPDREWWRGFRWRGMEVDRVELRAAGEVQYEKQPTGWKKTVRGVETRILQQVRQVLGDGNVIPQDSAADTYVYRFESRLPVLDPARQRVFSGRLEIHRRSGLPSRMLCQDSAGTVQWSLLLDRYNQAGKVVLPFVGVQELSIGTQTRLSRARLGQAVRILRMRLEKLGWEYSLKRKRGQLVLTLDRRLSADALALLLAAGQMELRAAASTADGGLQVGDDVSFKVSTGSLLARNGDWSVGEERAPLPEPKIVFVPSEAGRQKLSALGDSLVAFMLDGRVLDYARISTEGRLVFNFSGRPELASILAVVVSLPPSPASFRIFN